MEDMEEELAEQAHWDAMKIQRAHLERTVKERGDLLDLARTSLAELEMHRICAPTHLVTIERLRETIAKIEGMK